jgi:hydroxymethylpyrimidine kinase/phosphomethylpyrimidine kinase
VVLRQLRSALESLRPDAVKLGMLATDDVARAVEHGLAELRARQGPRPPLVIDPVLAASDGTPLLERRAWPTLLALLRGAALVTPNLREAEALTGQEAETRGGAERAARVFLEEHGAAAVLLKGGHREGAPDDLLAWRDGADVTLRWLPGERVPGGGAHGTGCALSAALAARLARGEPLPAAVDGARGFVAEALRRAVDRGGARFLVFP